MDPERRWLLAFSALERPIHARADRVAAKIVAGRRRNPPSRFPPASIGASRSAQAAYRGEGSVLEFARRIFLMVRSISMAEGPFAA